MTTTTSATTTATPTPTPTPTPTSSSTVVAGAAQSLLTSLGSGSGVDTTSLVSALVTAQYATQDTSLTTKASTLTAQISAVSSVKDAITTFSTALGTLVKGGTLTTQPVSSNTGVLSATALPGAKLAGLSSSVTVSQLASAQIAVSAAAIADHSAAIGTGTLTLTLGTATYSSDGGSMTGFTAGAGAPVDITLDDSNDSLDGIAAAINATQAGVTASVVTDADGSAYLSVKGATGKAQAFTLRATSDPSGNLAALDIGVGATGTRLASAAQNAKLTVDGVSVERTGNSIADIVPGVKLQLSAVSSVPVSLTSTTPTDALAGAVGDFVDAYNAVVGILTTQTDPINGVLKADPAARALLSSLKAMTLTGLVPGAAAGTPTTLAEIGVGTNRDGTLSLASSTLTGALAKWPASVEAMFAYSSDGSSGLSAILTALTTAATSATVGLGASTASYTASQNKVTDQQTDITDQKTQLSTRLTQQFASMQSQVSAYKATQSFLTNQIAAWNKSG